MINLLPIKEKRRIYKLYRMRLLSSALVFLFFSFLIGTVLLLPAFFFTNIKESEGENRLSVVREAALLIDAEKIKKEALRVSTRFNFLVKEVEKNDNVSQIFNSIVENADGTISLRGFLYQKSTTDRKVVINGNASDRESLTAFSNKLKENPEYTRVDLPISQFVESKDISFRISIFLNDE